MRRLQRCDSLRLAIGAAILVATACGGADSSPPAASASRDISGTLTLRDDIGGVVRPGDLCTGVGGYADIRSDAQVVVRDESDDVVAVGRIGAGSAVDSGRTEGRFRVVWCAFPITVPAVPESPFYSIEIAGRDPLSYSRAELEERDWTLDLTLGQ